MGDKGDDSVTRITLLGGSREDSEVCRSSYRRFSLASCTGGDGLERASSAFESGISKNRDRVNHDIHLVPERFVDHSLDSPLQSGNRMLLSMGTSHH